MRSCPLFTQRDGIDEASYLMKLVIKELGDIKVLLCCCLSIFSFFPLTSINSLLSVQEVTFCRYILVLHYQLEVQANPKNIAQKNDAIFRCRMTINVEI